VYCFFQDSILVIPYDIYVMMCFVDIVVCNMVYGFVHLYFIFFEYVSVSDSSQISVRSIYILLIFLQIIRCPFLL